VSPISPMLSSVGLCSHRTTALRWLRKPEGVSAHTPYSCIPEYNYYFVVGNKHPVGNNVSFGQKLMRIRAAIPFL